MFTEALVALLALTIGTVCVTNILLAFSVYLRARQEHLTLGTVHSRPNGNGTLFYEVPKHLEGQVIAAMRRHGYNLLWSRSENGTALTLFEAAA